MGSTKRSVPFGEMLWKQKWFIVDSCLVPVLEHAILEMPHCVFLISVVPAPTQCLAPSGAQNTSNKWK